MIESWQHQVPTQGRLLLGRWASPIGEPEHEAQRQLVAVLRREVHQRIRRLINSLPQQLHVLWVASLSTVASCCRLLCMPQCLPLSFRPRAVVHGYPTDSCRRSVNRYCAGPHAAQALGMTAW